MKTYLLYAKTNPAFLKTLKKELEFFGIHNSSSLINQRLSYLEIKCNVKEIMTILQKSKLIEDLKIIMNNKFTARSVF